MPTETDDRLGVEASKLTGEQIKTNPISNDVGAADMILNEISQRHIFPAVSLYETPWPNRYILALSNGLVAIVKEAKTKSDFNREFIDDGNVQYAIVRWLEKPKVLPGLRDKALQKALTYLRPNYEVASARAWQIPQIKTSELNVNGKAVFIVEWKDRRVREFIFNIKTERRIRSSKVRACAQVF